MNEADECAGGEKPIPKKKRKPSRIKRAFSLDLYSSDLFKIVGMLLFIIGVMVAIFLRVLGGMTESIGMWFAQHGLVAALGVVDSIIAAISRFR